MAHPDIETSKYEQGRAAGHVEQRLDNLDAHFERVNGSIDKSAAALEKLIRTVDAFALSARIRQEQSRRRTTWFMIGISLVTAALAVANVLRGSPF